MFKELKIISFFSICNELLLSSKHFKMENRNNFIKAIKKIKTEDTAHRKSDVGKVKATYGQQ